MATDELPKIVRRNDNQGLSGLQIQAAEMLLTESSVQSVADRLGITRQTLWRWTKEGRFNLYLAQREREVLEQVSRRMIDLADKSTQLLAHAINGGELTADQKFTIELTTKRLPRILEMSLLFSRLVDLEQSINTILEISDNEY